MTDKRDWSTYQHWYELLDALCVEKGYLDNMHLADRFCSASGNSTQVAFETAVKNASEMAEVVRQSSTEAIEILRARIKEAMEEVRDGMGGKK